MAIVRYVKIFLVLAVGFWGLMGAIGNLTSLPEVYNQVSQVTSMSAVPEGVGPPWRTTHPLVVSIGVALIVLGKIAAVIGGIGGIAMLRQVNATTTEFNKAKKWAVAGCGLAFAFTLFSFTLVAEGAFFMFFNSDYERAAALAFRFSGSFALVAIFVAQPEPGQDV